jgi:hypothetical protein
MWVLGEIRIRRRPITQTRARAWDYPFRPFSALHMPAMKKIATTRDFAANPRRGPAPAVEIDHK